MSKICSKCQEAKDYSEFSKRKASKDGLAPICKICKRYRNKKYNEENREVINSKNRKYYSKNKEGIKGKKRVYNEENRESINYKNKKYSAANRDKINSRNRRRKGTDSQYKMVCAIRNRFSHAIKGKSKSGSALKLLGCTIPEFLTYFETLFEPGMSWENHGKWHIDHIIPLCSFNLENREEALVACNFTNLQPLWAEDNLKKGGKY